MIPESIILLPVQHLQQSSAGIALVVIADLVDLIQKQQRVLDPCLPDRIGDPAGHGAHIGFAVAPDLSFIPDAAQTDADIFLMQRFGHASGDGRLAGARRAHQTDDRAPALTGQRTHGQIFQDPLLHLRQTVVVIV